MLRQNKRFAMSTLFGLCMLAAGLSHADQKSSDPVNLLYDFRASGQYLNIDQFGKLTYQISAEGRAPHVKENGLIKPAEADDDGYKVVLSGANITFDPYDPHNPPPVMRFSCEGCTIDFPDGSRLTWDPYVPLEGRALFLYGPVAFDPTKPIASIRMMGCSGLREVNGLGRLANKVGSICFNGEFNFDISNPDAIPTTLTGQSNCTIVMHTPPTHQ